MKLENLQKAKELAEKIYLLEKQIISVSNSTDISFMYITGQTSLSFRLEGRPDDMYKPLLFSFKETCIRLFKEEIEILKQQIELL